MAIEVTSGNTTLLQSQVASLLVQPLTQASTFLAAGPQIFDTSDQLRIPRIASGSLPDSSVKAHKSPMAT